MKIYLVQHGDSLAKEIDPERSLSEQGMKDVKSLGCFLSLLNIDVAHLYHSGKFRAQQTAEHLAVNIAIKHGIESRTGLDPLDDVIPMAKELNQSNQNLMLVGHLPFMDKLISQLVTNNEHHSLVSFEPGSMVCLEKTEEHHWRIAWMIRPELLGSLALD
ncbi:phosphohistidine phosphatase SixA [Legionella lansingensis]|uniref:Phosphohistidine phosphatase SixA n=1 Tax=Legionella lansingensis TaxID=45067 RepID=A0A0W0VH28_9GAMM|nr:phosphohistidine phosphatase SixA [Legionella lansingensis]KTD19078.1 phosphohistidine phosphatase SixA [Legionella lansingensis]SNV52106.1 phosphohistidine phosphatase SixA [Legionella lansingensis]